MTQYGTSVTLADNIKKAVASHIQAAKKSWSAPGASSEYYKEKDELVQGVTDAVVQGLKVRYGISEKTLQFVGQHVIDAVSAVVYDNVKELQGILEQEKSKGNPRHVADQFNDSV